MRGFYENDKGFQSKKVIEKIRSSKQTIFPLTPCFKLEDVNFLLSTDFQFSGGDTCGRR